MDVLKSLPEGELAKLPVPSDEEIRAALERGAENARRFLEGCAPPRSTGLRYR